MVLMVKLKKNERRVWHSFLFTYMVPHLVVATLPFTEMATRLGRFDD